MFLKSFNSLPPLQGRGGGAREAESTLLAWFDDPCKFGLRKLCVGDRCLTFVWVGDRVSAPRCIITDTMVGPKTKVNSYLKRGKFIVAGRLEGHWHIDGCPHQVWSNLVHCIRNLWSIYMSKKSKFLTFVRDS